MSGRVLSCCVALGINALGLTGAYPSSALPRPARAPAVTDLILTSQQLAPAFQRLANFQTAHGMATRVVTIEDVERADWPGRDPAEHVRSFLKDAHAHGVDWLLVGGSPAIVPMRNVPGTDQDSIATDAYYGGLEGDWDGNGNGIFGELFGPQGAPGDAPDLTPDLHVGRAPVATADEARQFVEHTLGAFAATRGGTRSADAPSAVVTADILLSPNWKPGDPVNFDLAPQAEALVATLAPLFPGGITRLYENYPAYPQAIPLDRTSFLAALANGPRAVFHVGRGNRTALSAGNDILQAGDLGANSNVGAPLCFISGGVEDAWPESSSPAGALLLDPRGGTYAFIGPTGRVFSATSALPPADLASVLATERPATIGEAMDLARTREVPLAGGSQSFFAIVGFALLGDPRCPSPTAAVDAVVHPGSAVVAATSARLRVMAPSEGGGVRLAFRAADAGMAYALGVFDVRGRRVRSLDHGVASPGAATAVAWDGRSDAGARLSPGVYFVALRVGEEGESVRVVTRGL